MIKPNFNSQSKKIQSSVQIDKAGQIIQNFSTKSDNNSDGSPKHDRGQWSLIIFYSIVFTSLLLTKVLCDERVSAITETKSEWLILLSYLAQPVICIAFILALSKAFRNISIRIIIFAVLPLCGTITSVATVSCLLDKPVTEIIEILITFQNKEDTEFSDQDTLKTPPIKTEHHLSDKTQKPDDKMNILEPPETTSASEPVVSQTPETDIQEIPPAVVTATVPAVKEPDFTNGIGMKFVLIPAGTFMMGSPENEKGRYSDETQHKVTLTKNFYMQTTEVTQGEWKELMGRNPSRFENCGDDCPVESVSWNDVQEFLDRLNLMGEGRYRLPTEAGWEYAARAGSITAFANGDITETECGHDPNLDAMGWYCGNSDRKTHPVAQKQPNAWGLYDMHGNVWEWCADFSDWKNLKVITDK